jgi:hypothetical protein
MQRYIVKFVEVRRYEMTVDAIDPEAAIRFAANGPDNPVGSRSSWIASRHRKL